MQDVMIDLETLGLLPGSVILSIGAVGFDKTGLGAQYYSVISQASSEAYGLKVDPETLKWWTDQSPEAVQVLVDSRSEWAHTLARALVGFNTWLRENYGPDVRVWGNGSDFDIALLAAAYAAAGLKPAWKFYNVRCFRTLKNVFGRRYVQVQAPPREGTHHNALDDAIYQARHAALLLKHKSDAENLLETAGLAKALPGTSFVNVRYGVTLAYSQMGAVRPTPYTGDMLAVSDAEAAAAQELMRSQSIAMDEAVGRTFTLTHASIDAKGSVTLGGYNSPQAAQAFVNVAEAEGVAVPQDSAWQPAEKRAVNKGEEL